MKTTRLSAVLKGQFAHIRRLPEGVLRSHFIRLGIIEGTEIRCLERLPGGTMVLQFRRREVALSADLTEAVWVAVEQAL